MDYVAKTAKTYRCPKGVVVNMSLGGGKSESVNQAANGIAKAGLFLAVAAGNSNDDANSYSPASASGACTVGATTKTDELASYSNYGPKVNVLAPGSNILSAWIGKTTKSISGTSMASPHVAGIGAYFLGLGVSVNGLCDYIASKGVQGAIANVPDDTANILINNGYNN